MSNVINIFGDSAPKILQPNFVARCTLTGNPMNFARCLVVENKDEVGIVPEQLYDVVGKWLVNFQKTLKNIEVKLDDASVVLTFNEKHSMVVLTALTMNGAQPLNNEVFYALLSSWLHLMRSPPKEGA